MTWGLVAVAGATLVGGIVSSSSASSAANKAANTQAAAADQSAQIQREGLAQQQTQFDQSRSDVAPWRNVGTNALLALSDQLGLSRPAGMESNNTGNPQFRADPGYQFSFDQGLKAVDARFPGMSQSGAKQKALVQYGQGVADQQYDNWLSRFSTLAGYGQNASNTLASVNNANAGAIGTASTNIGNSLENAAAARASGYVGGANATSGAISGGINNLASLYGMSGGFNSGSNLSGANDIIDKYAAGW